MMVRHASGEPHVRKQLAEIHTARALLGSGV